MGHLSIYLCLQFLSSKSYSFQYTDFTSLFKFLSILFFDTIVNGIVFFISFSDISLLIYRNRTDFYILILYPAILLNLLMSSNSFLVQSLGFSIYKITSSANKDNFTSSFLM